MFQFKWSQCLLCRRWPEATLCEPCRLAQAPIRVRCLRCAQIRLSRTSHRCVQWGPKGAAWQAASARVDYLPPFDAWVKRLKFAGDWPLGRTMGHLMRECPFAQALWAAADWILPMPVSTQRLRERGYNQAAWLARHWCGPDRRLQVHWLIKTRHTAAQAQTERDLRWAQLSDSMAVTDRARAMIRGARVLLVDDVMTTGASAQRASLCLMEAGAKRVDVAVFARTPPALH